MPAAQRVQSVRVGREIAAGLLVGAIWGIAEYLGNVVFFKRHWGWNLEVSPRGLLLSLLSCSVVGILLALVSCAIDRLPLPTARSGAASAGPFSLRVARYSYIVACIAVYVFIDAVLFGRISLLDRRTFPYLVAWAVATGLAYFGLRRLSRRRSRRGGGRSLAVVSIAALLGLVGTVQYIAVYHRLDAREDRRETNRPVIRDDLPNLLLVTIDTLRPDRLGCYGSRTVETRTLDALALQGILFENALTCIPHTLPSHTSIMTSLYPESHGVLMNVNYRVPEDRLTLAEVLRQAGYRTAAFVSSVVLGHRRGLDQGFERYDDEDASIYLTMSELLGGLGRIVPGRDVDWRRLFPRSVYRIGFSYRRARLTTDRAEEWLIDRRGEDRPFFLWIHYYDPHIPLNPPEPYADMYSLTEDMRRTIQAKEDSLVLHGPKWETLQKMPDPSLYDGEVTYVDDQLGRVIQTLEDQDLTASTLIVVTADHGEHLTEHNYFGHSMLLYRPSVDVPLIISHRGRLPAGERVRFMARTIDILPTILDHLGLPIPESMEGRSLLPDIRGSGPPGLEPSSLVETFSPEMPLLSYVRGRWTFIKTADGARKELYDNVVDPGQRENLYDAQGSRADSLEAMLQETRRRYAREGTAEEARSRMEAGTLEALRALGYVR